MHASLRWLLQIGVAALVVGAVVVAVVYWPRPAPKVEAQAGEWTCSMHPQIRLPGPGRCPICGMELIPVSQLSSEQAELDKRAGVETESIAARELFKEIRVTGKLDYNERQVAFISARIAGRVDRVYADFTGIRVKKNDHLVDIYSPDLFIAQGELIRAVDANGSGQNKPGSVSANYAESNLESARTKLRLLGLLPEQIGEIERSKTPTTHLTVFAPIGGTVIEKNVRAGQYVKEGDMLYRIADLDPIWLYLDVYEYDLSWVRFGQRVDVFVEAYPGESFEGTVTFIDPFLDDKTRTVKARVNLKNPGGRLKPAMYGSAVIRVRLDSDGRPEPTGLEGKYVCPMHPEIVQAQPGRCPICGMPLEKVPDIRKSTPHDPHAGHGGPSANDRGKVLAIPSSAVLDTGIRQIAYRQTEAGGYELVELKLGPAAQGKDDRGRPAKYYPILAGLKAGDRVVTQGGFLIDSQRQIEGQPSLLFPAGQGGASLHSGHAMPAAGEHKH